MAGHVRITIPGGQRQRAMKHLFYSREKFGWGGSWALHQRMAR